VETGEVKAEDGGLGGKVWSDRLRVEGSELRLGLFRADVR